MTTNNPLIDNATADPAASIFSPPLEQAHLHDDEGFPQEVVVMSDAAPMTTLPEKPALGHLQQERQGGMLCEEDMVAPAPLAAPATPLEAGFKGDAVMDSGEDGGQLTTPGDPIPRNVVMSDTARTTTPERPALEDVHHDQQPSRPRDDAPAIPATPTTPCEIDLTGEDGREHKPATPVVDLDPVFPVPTSTVAHRAQTPPRDLFHTPKSTGRKINTTPAPETPTTETLANDEDDDIVCTGSRPTPSRSVTPARPASAMSMKGPRSAKYGLTTPSGIRTEWATQEEHLQTPSKMPVKRSASAQVEPECSKKQKTPASAAADNDRTDTSATDETNTDDATVDHASDGTGEGHEDTTGSDSDRPGDKLVSAQAYKDLETRAKFRIEELKAQFRAGAGELQRLNELTDALRDEIELKNDDIKERDDEIAALEAERNKVRDRNISLATQMSQMKDKVKNFHEDFMVRWENEAREAPEAKNTREMKKQEERFARLTEKLQNKMTKNLEEAQAIKEKCKTEIKAVKADRDARVKEFMPEHSRTIRKKDADLVQKQLEIDQHARTLTTVHDERMRLRKETRNLERDLFNAEGERDRMIARHEKMRHELDQATQLHRKQIVEIDKLKRDHEVEIDSLRTSHEAEVADVRGALDEETQRVERLEEKVDDLSIQLEQLTRKLNRYKAALARYETNNTAIDTHTDPPRDGQDISASPPSTASTTDHTSNSLPDDTIMQEDATSQEPYPSPDDSQKLSTVETRYSSRVGSPKAD